ncbi:MAG: hypothetical protein WD512_05330 [Candidatus Paceibacterota bacterium]
MRNFIFYQTTDTYQRFSLGESAHFTILNSSLINNIDFSFDGVNKHGIVIPQVGFTFNDANENEVWFKSTNVGNPAVIYAWGHGLKSLVYPLAKQQDLSDSPLIPKSFHKFGGGS